MPQIRGFQRYYLGQRFLHGFFQDRFRINPLQAVLPDVDITEHIRIQQKFDMFFLNLRSRIQNAGAGRIDHIVLKIAVQHFTEHDVAQIIADLLPRKCQRNKLRHIDFQNLFFQQSIESCGIKHGARRQNNLAGSAADGIRRQFFSIQVRFSAGKGDFMRRLHLIHFARDIEFENIAVIFTHDQILGHIDQAAGQVTRVGRPKCGVSQTFAGAVRRNEVFENR